MQFQFVSIWNKIIKHFEQFPTWNNPKNHLHSLFRPKRKPIFDLHDQGLRYLFQLRVGLSPLRSHKRSHNFLDTPSEICLCKHFLLLCPIYANHRGTLSGAVNDILMEKDLPWPENEIQIYLYGHSLLNDICNRNILSYTVKFIIDSNRFSTS